MSKTDLSRSLRRYPGDFLECRDVGHHWKSSYVVVVRNTRGLPVEYETVADCATCKAQRVRVIDRSGEILRRTIRYPQGYLLSSYETGGLDVRQHRGEIRLVQVSRMSDVREASDVE